jgi:uncharacterized membrane protein
MIYALLKTVHLLSIIVWIGGMIFTLFFLRPALTVLEPPARIKLMSDVLGRFFRVVLIVGLLTVLSGFWMMGRVAKQAVQAGGSANLPTEWIVMAALGVLMFAIFGHIRFVLYKRLRLAAAASDWPAGGATLASIRTWVGVNLAIGIAIIVLVLIGLPK